MVKALYNEFAENTYIIKEKKEAVIIDPGANIDEIKDFISESGLTVKFILLTHGHFDHIFSINEVIEEFQCDVYCHELERDFMFDPNLNLSSITYKRITVQDKSRVKTFKDGDVFKLQFADITVVHNPGHTRGSSSFAYKKVLFVGDTLFSDGVGRTDLPTGNQTVLESSINKLLHMFSDNTLLYPGHGSNTTVLTLKNTNPYYIK
jgi:hydroxyacylglutathione hydrolase